MEVLCNSESSHSPGASPITGSDSEAAAADRGNDFRQLETALGPFKCDLISKCTSYTNAAAVLKVLGCQIQEDLAGKLSNIAEIKQRFSR